jgi:hypothetical protein
MTLHFGVDYGPGTLSPSYFYLTYSKHEGMMLLQADLERLPSNKESKSYKAFAERRLRTLSPEISPSVVPTLYRTPGRDSTLRHPVWKSLE